MQVGLDKQAKQDSARGPKPPQLSGILFVLGFEKEMQSNYARVSPESVHVIQSMVWLFWAAGHRLGGLLLCNAPLIC